MYKTRATIRKVGSQYCVFSKDGSKKFGCFSSRQGAEKRLKQIEYFKSQGLDMNYEEAFNNLAKAIKLGDSVNPQDVGGKPDARPREVKLSVEETLRHGTIAGRESPRLLDTRNHFPVSTEVQARAAINRSMQLTEVPVWYRGTLDNLREEVYLGAVAAHPHLHNINVAVPADQAIALSDGETEPETKTGDVKNPANVRENEAGAKRPSLTTSELTVRVLMKECENDEARRALAGHLVVQLEKQKDALDSAMKVAERLESSGLSAEEFKGLISYLQEDILRDLLMNGTSASTLDRRQELLEKLKKNEVQ